MISDEEKNGRLGLRQAQADKYSFFFASWEICDPHRGRNHTLIFFYRDWTPSGSGYTVDNRRLKGLRSSKVYVRSSRVCA